MELRDEVKAALRLSSDDFDAEVDALIAAAKRDMARVGVPDALIEGDALSKMAVVLFCKSRFGYDNSEAPRFEESYRQTVVDMLNSPTSYAPEGGGDEVE